VAGKGVSTGLTKVLDKTTKQLDAAAQKPKADVPPPPPLLQVGPASVSQQSPYNVPPPPPLASEIRRPAPAPVVDPEPEVAQVFLIAPTPMAKPAPPKMSAEELATIAPGMSLSEVLGFGRNAVRLMKSTGDGHTEEVLRYRDGSTPLGVVRVVDGRVASVELEPR